MLSNASDGLARSFERLASGQRINGAGDDAAGLAVADNLRVNTRLYSSAIRNINDGLSAINIANGAMDSQTEIVTRLAELAEQAANGSLSNTQRRSLDAEYQALISESGRIGAVTTFNGIALLHGTRDGNSLSLALQAGITGGSSSQISFSRSDVGAFSGSLNLSSTPFSTSAGYFDWITANFGRDTFSTDELAATFGSAMARVSSTDESGNKREVLVAVAAQGVNGNGLSMLSFVQSTTDSNQWINEINSGEFDDYVAGGNAFFDSSGRITTNGGIITLSETSENVDTVLDLRGLLITGTSTSFGVMNGGTAGSAINFTNVLSQTSARTALDVSQRRLEELAILRGQLGSVQSRLGSALGLNQITLENTAAAESRIRDVDIAEETSVLAAGQIKQQLASAILSQVNVQPKLLISLLQ